MVDLSQVYTYNSVHYSTTPQRRTSMDPRVTQEGLDQHTDGLTFPELKHMQRVLSGIVARRLMESPLKSREEMEDYKAKNPEEFC